MFYTFGISALLWLTGCNGKNEDDKTTSGNAATSTKVTSKYDQNGDFGALSGEFPQGAIFISAIYGTDKPVRVIQRAWNMTQDAGALKNVDKALIDSVKGILGAQKIEDMG